MLRLTGDAIAKEETERTARIQSESGRGSGKGLRIFRIRRFSEIKPIAVISLPAKIEQVVTMTDREILIKQLNMMAVRIMEEGKHIESEPLVMEYDNGGGQSGVRENPFYPAYEKLLASYTKTLTAVKNMGGASEEVSSLDSLRNKFKVAK